MQPTTVFCSITMGSDLKGKPSIVIKVGATLKGKNLLSVGSKFFLVRIAPILEAMLGKIVKIFPGCA